MSDYETKRDLEYASKLQAALEEFASQYGGNTSTENRRTIFLFPGGLASQLMRADRPYPEQPQVYEMSWLDCGIFSGDGRTLGMSGNVDFEHRYIVADGCVDFFNLQPYNNFIQWCRDNWIDLFVFGWDWRRGVQGAAYFFLKKFMPVFESRFSGHTPHPLDNFTLIGHSAGGMVVKTILNDAADPYVQRMKKAITVAAPFYGYGGQIHRYLKGDPDLNRTAGTHGPSIYTRIISSMPGGYEFLYLDRETYDANKTAFANDPEGYNLLAYPSLDKTHPTEAADPYDPQPDAQGRLRYPLDYGFDSSLLQMGKLASRRVSDALDPNVAGKFYNIRGVQSNGGHDLDGTVVGLSWERVPPSFDPDTDPDPIGDDDQQMGPGDSVQPAWTTRLLGLPDPAHQVITIGGDIEHMTMMGNSEVQAKIAELLELNPDELRFTVDRAATEEFVASRMELNNFLDGMQKVVAASERTPAFRRIAIAQFLRKFKPADLHKLLARAYIDALKSPSQKIGRPPRPRPAGESRTRAGRSRRRS
jgi:hypothetical protein